MMEIRESDFTVDTRAIFVSDQSMQSYCIPSRDHPRRKDSSRALHAKLATSAFYMTHGKIEIPCLRYARRKPNGD